VGTRVEIAFLWVKVENVFGSHLARTTCRFGGDGSSKIGNGAREVWKLRVTECVQYTYRVHRSEGCLNMRDNRVRNQKEKITAWLKGGIQGDLHHGIAHHDRTDVRGRYN
jgi:hypothetical protein